VSRTTVRKAISMLVDEGTMTIVRGRGTMGSPTRLSYRVAGLMSFTELMKQQGLRAIEEKQSPYKVLEEDCNIEIHSTEDTIQAIKASKVQAEILHVGQNDPLLFIERLAYSKGGEIDTSTPSR